MDPRVQKVVTRLREEFRQEPSLGEMAQLVNLSLSRLRYLFKRETGVAPGHYLRAFRLARAKELLETTFLSVKEIISTIGVNDQSHFIREFKVLRTHSRAISTAPCGNNDVGNHGSLEGLLVLVVEDDPTPAIPCHIGGERVQALRPSPLRALPRGAGTDAAAYPDY